MNNLQLKIILSAADKLLTPLKRNLQGSKQLAAGLQQAKKYAQELNNQNLDVTKYRNLSRSIGITANELKTARTRAEELAKGINSTNAPTKAMIKEFDRAKTIVNELQGKQTAQINQQQRLRESMKNSGIDVKRLASEQRRLKSDMQSANNTVDQQRKKLDQLNETQKRLHAAKASYQKTKELQGKMAGTGAGMIATGVTMSSPVVAAVKQYADFEDAMKGVAKQVNGARDDNGKLTSTYYDMAKAIKAISERLQSENGAIDIAALVEGAARMGIQGTDNLLRFAEASAKASKAFELPAGDLAENMGKIANLYKIPIGNIEQLGDVINYLDDNAQSKGSDIIDVLQRMGGVADKLDYKKAAALGSTFLSLGAQSDVAATASIAMVRELSIATMQGKRFQAGMETLGLSSEKMEKRMSDDAMGTIITVLEKINKLPKDVQMRVTTQLFGKEYGKDAGKLANNLTELHNQLKLVNDEKAKGSMQRESDIDADSLSAQWALLKSGIANTFSSLGSTLRSPLMDILGRVKQITIATRQWIEGNPELSGTILKILAVVSTVTVAVGGLSLAIAGILGPIALAKFSLSTLGIKILPDLGAALTGTGGSLKEFARLIQSTKAGNLKAEFGAAKAAIAGSESPLVKMRGHIKRNRGGLIQLTSAYAATGRAFSKSLSVLTLVKNNPLQFLVSGARMAGSGLMWLATSPFKAISGAISWLGSSVLWLGRLFLMNPIGLFVTAVIAGASLIIKYWAPIKAFIGGVVAGFSAAIEPIKALFTPLQPIFDGIGNALKWVFNLFGDLFTPVKTTSAELNNAAAMGRKFGEWLASGVNIALTPLKTLIDGIKWVLDNLPKIDMGEGAKNHAQRIASNPNLASGVLTGNYGPTVSTNNYKPITIPKQSSNFSGLYDSGGYIPKGKFGIAGENGPEVVNGPAHILSRTKTASIAAVLSALAAQPLLAKQPIETNAHRSILERTKDTGISNQVTGSRVILEQLNTAKLLPIINEKRNIIDDVGSGKVKATYTKPINKNSLVIHEGDIHLTVPITINPSSGVDAKEIAKEIRMQVRAEIEMAQRKQKSQSRSRLSDRD